MSIRKYVAIATVAARQRLLERTALVGRMAFYAFMLFVFAELWEAVLSGESLPGIGPENFVWYIATTEWIVLSIPPVHLHVEEDLNEGTLIYQLTRPTPYPLAKLSEAFGDMLVRLASLGAAGFILAYVVTGVAVLGPLQLMVLIPLGVTAASLQLVFQFTIGLGSFWIHDCRPLHWVWQKAGFVLGGLLVPLSFYPDWLRTIALASPFAAMLHGPGQLALGAELSSAFFILAKLLVWMALAITILILVYRRARRRVTVGGG